MISLRKTANAITNIFFSIAISVTCNVCNTHDRSMLHFGRCRVILCFRKLPALTSNGNEMHQIAIQCARLRGGEEIGGGEKRSREELETGTAFQNFEFEPHPPEPKMRGTTHYRMRIPGMHGTSGLTSSSVASSTSEPLDTVSDPAHSEPSLAYNSTPFAAPPHPETRDERRKRIQGYLEHELLLRHNPSKLPPPAGVTPPFPNTRTQNHPKLARGNTFARK
mmetsp:Transcript_79075/g.212217  ORF Transcript_79075/g.212217 Transcript_79075/m.212217 type:complete len:222 (-) Transcript_79075:24-689(-)